MSVEKLFPNKLKCKPIPMMPFSFTINGQKRNLDVPPTYRLVDMIRNELNLTGTKLSCGIGRCGVCAVLMNGKLVNSCLIMAYQANQAEIETIESIATKDLHPIQEAFIQEGALQCGYCTPGMIMAIKALLDQNSKPTREEIESALSGNLCRCTGYGGIIRAIERVVSVGGV
ncbi:2Fe-2S iron-sulfur cluster-binding protein [Bacillus sp. 1NLA3E]|jgi:carbon-monoxide dehydrogenase small subunit|uniref:(2Fe-2S)-binding protein n=1 Tax=Bacillus sp. 1NLA3E TaxID=666686 RepID=UPI000247E7F0